MATDVSLRCKCGTIRGVARNSSAKTGNHVVCHCADCATFAEALDRSDALDQEGGSHIFQTAPAWVSIEEGHEQLRCLRLSPKGLHRWYAGCCHTLIGNTLGPKSPFVGLLTDFMAPGEGKSVDDVLGPVRAAVNGKAAGRPMPAHVHPRIPVGNLLHVVGCAARWLLAGKAQPFARARADSMRILTKEERQTAREAVIRRGGPGDRPSPLA
jgi:hypothetical protein